MSRRGASTARRADAADLNNRAALRADLATERDNVRAALTRSNVHGGVTPVARDALAQHLAPRALARDALRGTIASLGHSPRPVPPPTAKGALARSARRPTDPEDQSGISWCPIRGDVFRSRHIPPALAGPLRRGGYRQGQHAPTDTSRTLAYVPSTLAGDRPGWMCRHKSPSAFPFRI